MGFDSIPPSTWQLVELWSQKGPLMVNRRSRPETRADVGGVADRIFIEPVLHQQSYCRGPWPCRTVQIIEYRFIFIPGSTFRPYGVIEKWHECTKGTQKVHGKFTACN